MLTIISPEARFRYEEAYRIYQVKAYPGATKNFGYLKCKFPDTRTSNGLTVFICNALKWLGHHAERTNTMGRPIQKKIPRYNLFSGKVEHMDGGIEWQKGSGIKGSSDIKGHLNTGRAIYIEVKIKDKQSQAQVKYEKQVTSTGALYSIIRDPDSFWVFYDYCVKL